MSAVMQEWPRPHQITADEYHRMAELDLLAPDARVELIEGEIIDMALIGVDHSSVVMQLTHLLVHAVGDRAIVRVQGSVRVGCYSEPQPDVVLLKPRSDFYRSSGATASDTHLIVEVSDSTLRYDLHTKVPLYARHEIPEVWVVDIPHNQLHVFRGPKEGAYRDASVSSEPGVLRLSMLPDVEVDLAPILKPPA
jgi:Uma2 family endonuclease